MHQRSLSSLILVLTVALLSGTVPAKSTPEGSGATRGQTGFWRAFTGADVTGSPVTRRRGQVPSHAIHNSTIAGEREGKIFSVFSIVSFPNGACTSNLDYTNGTCLSPSDCSSLSGSAEGSCAAGFGICCIKRVESCGGTISSNVTLIQNPGYPGKYNSEGTCTYIISQQSADICQIRLDFQVGTWNYASTGTTGCVSGTTDYITFTLKNGWTYSPVCGELTGQHMYYEVGTAGDTVQIDMSLKGSTDRQWNILVSQISCTWPWRAPDDCLQYHTGPTGDFSSFNFPNGQLLSSQNYRICIRQELGYCSITYSTSSVTSPDPFEMPSTNSGTTTANKCMTAYISIPIGGDTGISDSQALRYCGSAFDSAEGSTNNGLVSSAVVPFEVQVLSNESLFKTGKTGFNLKYRQKYCEAV